MSDEMVLTKNLASAEAELELARLQINQLKEDIESSKIKHDVQVAYSLALLKIRQLNEEVDSLERYAETSQGRDAELELALIQLKRLQSELETNLNSDYQQYVAEKQVDLGPNGVFASCLTLRLLRLYQVRVEGNAFAS